MITTLTVNPCIDKTLSVEKFDVYEMNRAEVVSTDASGKGINVSLALRGIGENSRCIGFNFNKENNDYLPKYLEKKGLLYDFVEVNNPLRTCTKIFVKNINHSIEVNEYGSGVDVLDGEKVLELIKKYAKDSFAITLSGSIPKGLNKDFYFWCLTEIKKINPKCFVAVDAEKELLTNALRGKPDFIKPNVFEFQQTFNCSITDNASLKEKAIEVLKEYGLQMICISLGKDGAFITDGKESYIAKPVKVDIKSIQGAGDAMVAGILLATEKGLFLKERLHYGICLSAGKISLEGTKFCDKNTFLNLLERDIEIKTL